MNINNKLNQLRSAWLAADNQTDKKIIEMRAKLLTKPGTKPKKVDLYQFAQDLFNND
jgi:hypothetical protein